MTENTKNVLFMSLCGSHNYNLNDENSDRDYKAFFVPSFDDIYNGNMSSTVNTSTDVDIEYHDIRKLIMLLKKANPSYLEVLFSKDIVFGENVDGTQIKLMKTIIEQRENIIKYNVRGLYYASRGMALSCKDKILKERESNVEVMAKHGYDIKMAYKAYQALDVLDRYYENGFSGFGSVLWYENDTNSRKIIKNVKNGAYNLDKFRILYNDKLKKIYSIEKAYQEFHKQGNIENQYAIDYLEDTLKSIVRFSVVKEILN